MGPGKTTLFLQSCTWCIQSNSQ